MKINISEKTKAMIAKMFYRKKTCQKKLPQSKDLFIHYLANNEKQKLMLQKISIKD